MNAPIRAHRYSITNFGLSTPIAHADHHDFTAEEARAAWTEGEWIACILEPRVSDGGVALVRELRSRSEARDAAILTYSTAAASAETAAWTTPVSRSTFRSFFPEQ